MFFNIISGQAARIPGIAARQLSTRRFYNSTNGDDWYNNTNWLDGPLSSWYSVTVTSNRVTGIILMGNELSGTRNSSIGDLTALRQLDLIENYEISGEIPDETVIWPVADCQHDNNDNKTNTFESF